MKRFALVAFLGGVLAVTFGLPLLAFGQSTILGTVPNSHCDGNSTYCTCTGAVDGDGKCATSSCGGGGTLCVPAALASADIRAEFGRAKTDITALDSGKADIPATSTTSTAIATYTDTAGNLASQAFWKIGSTGIMSYASDPSTTVPFSVALPTGVTSKEILAISENNGTQRVKIHSAGQIELTMDKSLAAPIQASQASDSGKLIDLDGPGAAKFTQNALGDATIGTSSSSTGIGLTVSDVGTGTYGLFVNKNNATGNIALFRGNGAADRLTLYNDGRTTLSANTASAGFSVTQSGAGPLFSGTGSGGTIGSVGTWQINNNGAGVEHTVDTATAYGYDMNQSGTGPLLRLRQAGVSRVAVNAGGGVSLVPNTGETALGVTLTSGNLLQATGADSTAVVWAPDGTLAYNTGTASSAVGLSVNQQGSGNVLTGAVDGTERFSVSNAGGATVSTISSGDALTVNHTGTGDLIDAKLSGTSKFRVLNDGTIVHSSAASSPLYTGTISGSNGALLSLTNSNRGANLAVDQYGELVLTTSTASVYGAIVSHYGSEGAIMSFEKAGTEKASVTFDGAWRGPHSGANQAYDTANIEATVASSSDVAVLSGVRMAASGKSCVEVTDFVPNEVHTSGNITLRAAFKSVGAATNNVAYKFQADCLADSDSTASETLDLDQTTTTVAQEATAAEINLVSTTVAVPANCQTGGNLFVARWCRMGDDAGDTSTASIMAVQLGWSYPTASATVSRSVMLGHN